MILSSSEVACIALITCWKIHFFKKLHKCIRKSKNTNSTLAKLAKQKTCSQGQIYFFVCAVFNFFSGVTLGTTWISAFLKQNLMKDHFKLLFIELPLLSFVPYCCLSGAYLKVWTWLDSCPTYAHNFLFFWPTIKS